MSGAYNLKPLRGMVRSRRVMEADGVAECGCGWLIWRGWLVGSFIIAKFAIAKAIGNVCICIGVVFRQ